MAVRAASSGEKAPNILVRIGRFCSEAYAEMLKVIWPSFEEVRKFTVVVMCTVIAIAIFIWICDIVFGQITKALYGLGQ